MAVTLTPFAGLDNSTVENPEALYLVGGSGTDLDGKLVRAVALVDPATGQAMVPGSVTFTSLSMADGDDVAEGATTDSAGDPTVLGQLKQVTTDLAGVLAVSASDGSVTTLGSAANVQGDPTVMGQLLQVVAELGGTLHVDASGATVPVSAASPLLTIPPKGSTTLSQVTVGTTPTLLLAANPARISAVIQNVAGGSALVLGNDANVVAAAPGEGQYLGLLVAAGADAEDADSTSAWYGVCQSGSADVRMVEVS